MANKRQKLEVNIKDKFHTGLLEKESTQKIETAFKDSKPYLHCKIDTLVNDVLLRNVRKEILNNISFTLKETDIYKVNLLWIVFGTEKSTHASSGESNR